MIEVYKISLEQVRYEGNLTWKVFSSFLLTHTIFLGFLLTYLSKGAQKEILFLTSLFGLVLCLPWLAAYLRSSDYYRFRMAQARKAEPESHSLLKQGKLFSEGASTHLNYRMGWLARTLPTKQGAIFLIITYIMFYLIIFISTIWSI